MTVDSSTRSTQAWCSILSGLAGLLSFACLLAYLTHPALRIDDSGATPPIGRLLLNSDFFAAILQALLLIPLANLLARRHSDPPQTTGRVTWLLGLAGLSMVALLRLLPILTPTVSDILFMLPIGLIGAWLLRLNWPPKRMTSRATAILGTVAAICLIGVSLNFLFNGGTAVFTQGPLAYSSNVPFHVGLALTGTPAFILFQPGPSSPAFNCRTASAPDPEPSAHSLPCYLPPEGSALPATFKSRNKSVDAPA